LAAGLETFPEEILDLSDTLEVLSLSGNRLRDLPEGFSRLHHLKILFLSSNRFEHVPEVLGRLPELEMVGFKSNRISRLDGAALPPRLRWLILTDNLLEELPAQLGGRKRLQKAMLAGNRLRSLPREMSGCENLELLRISANRLERLPDWLWRLPRLSWLALAGNPLCRTPKDAVPTVAWSDLALAEVLGEGASGVISRAVLAGAGEVAVKVFKGSVTSDGLPADEMAASLAAGSHPNMVPVLGSIQGHPQGKCGLAMERIPADYRSLGEPPSFESCTRDVFSPQTVLEPAQALRVARGIASLASHLHGRGIVHGDLYAHNILVNGDGHAMLGDFGAASLLHGLSPAEMDGLCRIESRACGCLLDDLLSLAGARDPQGLLASMGRLRDRCLSPIPSARPLAREILAELGG